MPINPQLEFFQKLGRYSTPAISVSNVVQLASPQQLCTGAHGIIEDSSVQPLPCEHLSEIDPHSDNQSNIDLEYGNDYMGLEETEHQSEPVCKSVEEEFEQALQDLSSVNETIGSYIQKL